MASANMCHLLKASGPACRYEMVSAFWSCAKQIEQWAAPSYGAVLWFLVSDSKVLRKVRPLHFDQE